MSGAADRERRAGLAQRDVGRGEVGVVLSHCDLQFGAVVDHGIAFPPSARACASAEICTIDGGSMNFGKENVVVNRPRDLAWMARRAQEMGVKPELECFDMGQVQHALDLVDAGLIDGRPMFQFVLGVAGGAPATAESMMTLRNMLPASAFWAAFGISRHEFPMVAQAGMYGSGWRTIPGSHPDSLPPTPSSSTRRCGCSVNLASRRCRPPRRASSLASRLPFRRRTMASAAADLADIMLKPVLATPESLDGYGWIIGQPGGLDRDKIDFYGREVRVTQPAQFHSNADTCLNLVSFKERPLTVRWMEYHTKHTQTFIPLSGKPFYMVLGKPTRRRPDGSFDETRPPDPDLGDVTAFYFDGSAGIVMHVGTWHEVPFPIDGDTHFVVICTNETNDNLEQQDEHGESRGGDLDKVRIERRFGRRIVVAA